MVSRNTAHGMHNTIILFFQRPEVLREASGFFVEGFDMVKLEPGMLVKTSYGEQIFRIKEVHRNCTCPRYVDTINMEDPPDRPPHVHLVCSDEEPKSRTPSFLGDYDEETLKDIDESCLGETDELKHEYLIILKQDKPIQKTLFN
jgi:hypothetical protein